MSNDNFRNSYCYPGTTIVPPPTNVEFTLESYFKGLNKITMADDKDMVNSPAHYTQGDIECIDAIAQVVKDLDGMEAMCTGNAIKYLWRWKHKNGVEDLKKAQWYLQRMIDNYKE
jgi:hypothetical protein